MKRDVRNEIQKIKYLFEYKMGSSSEEHNSMMNEYDIDDDNIKSSDFIKELTSDGGDEIIRDMGISTTNEEEIQQEASEMLCQFSDMDSYVEKKFGSTIKEKFKDKAQEVLDTIKEYLNKFIDFLTKLNVSELKKIFKDLKSKKSEAEKSEGGDEVLKEFFGTSMALITIGSFAMPALVLSIASITLTVLIGIWLIKAILCSFNISFSSKKRCRVRSFEWGQCK
jgi:hypothetical protein